MERARTTWTDERLDDRLYRIDEDVRALRIDLGGRIDRVESRIDHLEGRIDRLQATMIQLGGAAIVSTLATLVTVLATRGR
jgi:hypothetical protein